MELKGWFNLRKIYTKYFAFTNDEMPGWYLDLLISDELEGQFQIASIRFLIENRKDAEPLFRRNNRLRNMIEENYSRKDWESQIAELLKAILKRNDCNEEIFSYWFLGLFQNNKFVGTILKRARLHSFFEVAIDKKIKD